MKRALAWLCLAAALSACDRPAAPPPPGILRTAGADDVPTLDPAIGYDTTSWLFEQMLFNTLVDYDDASRLVPEVATSWQSSGDGRVYTFQLSPSVRFSNGRRLVASDVKYSIERLLRPSTRSQGAEFFTELEGADRFLAGEAPDVRGIEVLDDTAVRFSLHTADPLFLHKLALQFAAVVPREVAEEFGEDFSSHPVGSGPFVLTEWQRGQWLRFRRNPLYFVSGLPRIQGVDHLIGVNAQLQWLKFEAGEVDVAYIAGTIPSSEFPRAIRDPAYRDRLVSETEMRTNYIGMNCQMPPFTDVRVRRAIVHAINCEKALRLINNRGVVARGILPPSMPGYEVVLSDPTFDPETARTLLRDAGLKNGFETTLWTRSDEDALRLAQSYQQDLAAVGITARIKNISWASFLEAIRTPNLVPLFMLGWQADFPDPSNFLEVLFHSRNIGSNNNTFFADPEVDALLDQAAGTVDARARLTLLSRAHARIIEQAVWVPLYHPASYSALHPRVRNYRIHPLRPPRLDTVVIEDLG